MTRTTLPIPVGLVMMALAIICLTGWYFWDWTFVDPYFSTLVFFGGPFFIGMGFANPRPRPSPEGYRARLHGVAIGANGWRRCFTALSRRDGSMRNSWMKLRPSSALTAMN
jgi:hypothetical protein